MEFIAPNGCALQGTSETVLRVCEVRFGDTSDDYDFIGDDDVFWDTSETKSLEGSSYFTDEDGNDWLQHHLIPEDCEPMSDKDLAVLVEEDELGEALTAVRNLRLACNPLNQVDRTQIRMIAEDLERRYLKAKLRSISLVQAHIKAHHKEDEDA